MEIDIALCHRIGNIDSYFFLSLRICIGHSLCAWILSLCAAHDVSNRCFIIVVAYLTIELSILRSIVISQPVSFCIATVVTSAIETIYTNRINTRNKTCDLLIGVIVLAVVLSTVGYSTAASESVTAPSCRAVAIVECRVHYLTAHVGRLFPSSMTLTPLHKSSIQILKSLLQLSNSSIAFSIYGIKISCAVKATSLSIFQSLLQGLTSFNNSLNIICSFLQIIQSAFSIIVDSQPSSNICTQSLGLFQSSLQRESLTRAFNSLRVGAIGLLIGYKSLI